MRLRFKKGTGAERPDRLGGVAVVPQALLPRADGPGRPQRGRHSLGINALSYDPAGGVTSGRIRHVHLALSGPHCSAVIDGSSAAANDGTLAFQYNNELPSTLQTGGDFGSNLRAYNVTGCRKMLHSGDVVRVFLGYDLNRALTVTSP